MSLPLPASLSPSKLSSFRTCPLAFRLSSIDGLPEAATQAMAKGTLVHKALERLYVEVPRGERTPEVAVALLHDSVASVLSHREHAALHWEEGGRQAFVADAEALVRNDFVIEDPNAVDAGGIEVKLRADLDGLSMRGVIDRLDVTAEGLVVTDYKTGRAPSETWEGKQMAGVHFYAFLCEQVLGVRPVRIQLLHLREPVALTIEPSDQSTRGLGARAAAVWDAVTRCCEQEDFRPRIGFACTSCSYQAYCPAQGGDPSLVPAAAEAVRIERGAA